MNKSNIKSIEHMSNNTMKYCKICDTTIKGNEYKFRCHLYKHKAVKSRFECGSCFKQFFRKDSFVQHQRTHSVKPNNRKSYVCDYCDRSFLAKNSMIYHLKIHDDSIQRRRDLKFKCMACGISYCEGRLLKLHVRKTHYNLQAQEELHLKKTLNETWVEKVKDSKVCVEMTKVNNNVIVIKKCVKPEVKDILMVNNNSEIQDLSLTYSINHYSKVVCDYCKKEMLKKSLVNHIRETHFNFRKFKCAECKRQFHRHYQMVNHICGKKARQKVYRSLVNEQSK